MKRTNLSLIAVVALLAAIVGAATVAGPEEKEKPAADAAPASAARMPVQRTTLTCPAPSTSEFAETTYTAYSASTASGDTTPDKSDKASSGSGESAQEDDKAELLPALGDGEKGKKAKALAPLSEPGRTASDDTDEESAPALIGNAAGALAPGYTVQQTTEISLGDGRGLLGTSCTAPRADFWFAGASTDEDRQDYVHLTNPDDTPAVVALELYGAKGAVETTADDVNVPPHSTVPVRLSTLIPQEEKDLVVHAIAREGRVGAALQAVDTELGGDWIPASAGPRGSVVIPGLPKDTEDARLVVFAPGSDDADLKVRLATPASTITPAGHETLHVKNGMVAFAELEKITQGEAGSLVLTPSDPKDATPVVAGLQVVRGKGGDREMAYISATDPVKEQATVSGNERDDTTLFLTAPEKAAEVTVVSTADGKPEKKTVSVKAGTTVALDPPEPSGKRAYAVTILPGSGGPVYAARMLAKKQDGVPMFTVQPVPDDGATVSVPTSEQDIAVVRSGE